MAKRAPAKNHCAHCGKKHPHLALHEGKWYCPGACNVTRGKKPAQAQATSVTLKKLRDELVVIAKEHPEREPYPGHLRKLLEDLTVSIGYFSACERGERPCSTCFGTGRFCNYHGLGADCECAADCPDCPTLPV
jgi:hypothetical protein